MNDNNNTAGRRDFLRLSSMAAGVAMAGLHAAPQAAPLARANKSVLHHRFGLNYVPSKNWYYCYNDWSLAHIRADMERMASLGIDHLRVMVVWPYFQTTPRTVSNAHLDRLDQLMQAAAAVGLDVMPCLYTGWLSGFNFNPYFYQREPFYTSPKWAAAQAFYLKALSGRMAHHTNFMGFDVGNEINCNWTTNNLAEGDAWMAEVLRQMHAQAPGKIHVNGVDHAPWFQEHTFSVQGILSTHEIVPLHCWPYWTGAATLGAALDRPYTHMGASMAQLVRSYARNAAKPVWMQEFGAGELDMPAKDLSRYIATAIEAALDKGVSWITWWASHDVSRQYEFHEFEYTLGLFDVNNKPKAHAKVFQRYAEQLRGKPVSLPTALPLPPPPKRTDQETWKWLLNDMKS